jgi:hypothetical protein
VDTNNVQKKLSLRATRDPHHRFEDLYGLLYTPDWLETARRHVSRNKGKNTPGVDGMTMTKFEADLEANMWGVTIIGTKTYAKAHKEPSGVPLPTIVKPHTTCRPQNPMSLTVSSHN